MAGIGVTSSFISGRKRFERESFGLAFASAMLLSYLPLACKCPASRDSRSDDYGHEAIEVSAYGAAPPLDRSLV